MASVKDGHTGRQTDHAGDGHAATIPAQGPAQVGTGPRAAHIPTGNKPRNIRKARSIMSTPLTTQQAVDLYTTMRKIRRFEETVKAHIGKEIVGPAHLYIGEEAVATGVCSNLTHHDYVTSTHRGHGHTLAKGARVDRSLASSTAAPPDTARARAAPCISQTSASACWARTAWSAAASTSPPARRSPSSSGTAATWPCASSATAHLAEAPSTRP